MESPGIEPGSKQGSKELSTRLVSDWIFDVLQGRKPPQDTYSLKSRNPRRTKGSPGLFLRFPYTKRHKPRLFRRISLSCLAGTRLILTIIQIKQQERSYFRRLKVRGRLINGNQPQFPTCLLFISACCQNQSTPIFSLV